MQFLLINQAKMETFVADINNIFDYILLVNKSQIVVSQNVFFTRKCKKEKRRRDVNISKLCSPIFL